MTSETTAAEILQVRLRLRPELQCTLQVSGGETYCQVEDTLTRRFYRLGVREWDVARRMDGQRMLSEVIEQVSHAIPDQDDRLSATEVVNFARWLVQSQLAVVQGKLTHAVFTRSLTPNAMPGWLNPAFMRFPLFNPDNFLTRCTPWLRWTLTPLAVAVWGVISVVAIYEVASQWTRFVAPIATILAPNNWLYLLVAWVGLKAVHEFYHGMICKRHGGQVPVCGIALILFSPVAFVDVTSSWKFRSKWHRIYTSAGGMYAELFVASVMALIWSQLDDGWASQVCHNVMIMASVSTLLFNGNFLMRFDGYFILSDLFGFQNLYSSGQQYVRYLGRRYCWGVDTPLSIEPGLRGAAVKAYGVASLGWRLLFYVGIVLTAATMFHGAGIVVSVIVGILWMVLPASRLIHFFIYGRGREQPRRLRFIAFAALAVAIVAGLSVLPWPGGVVVTGVVDYEPIARVRAESSGFVRQLHVRPGQRVNAGDPLVSVDNPSTRLELLDVGIAIRQSDIRGRILQDDDDVTSYQVEKKSRESLDEQRGELADKVAALEVIAPVQGRVLGRELPLLRDQYLHSGTEILAIGDDTRKAIVVAVPQQEVKFFLRQLGERASVRVWGREHRVRGTHLVKVDPRASELLPHPALAATNGGPLPVSVQGDSGLTIDGGGLRLVEPHFRATISVPADEARRLHAGELARVRIRTTGESVGTHLWTVVDTWIRHKLGAR